MSPVFVPAIGALLVLAFDLVARPAASAATPPRGAALEGIRLGAIALVTLGAALFGLRGERPASAWLALDGFAAFGIGLVAISGVLVLSLSLTHFGMARSRPAEPIALLLFAWSGSMAALASDHLVVLLLALELAWLPMIALVAIDSRRLSSSESSLKAFFAHVFAGLVFAHGVGFVFGATGRLDLGALAGADVGDTLLFQVGATLVLLGVLARGMVAPFHPWAPDVHEGAPSFVTTHIATVAQATTFFVLLRLLHAMPSPEEGLAAAFAERLPGLLAWLGVLGLLWGHAMALVQVGLRRLVGWLGVGQAGFCALALVDARGPGGEALVLALIASGVAIAGVMATLSSLSHHERACEQIGDLGGMMRRSPIRASLLGVFLLSLAGLPGTFGFVARFGILASLEHAGHRGLLVVGLVATMLALTAVGRPLRAMLRPDGPPRAASGALTHEQFVLLVCGVTIVYLGLAPVLGEGNLATLLGEAIRGAVGALRGEVD